ncbi:MAG: hypothetical protein M3467_05720 [Actinomycetota bacterium]|nr:hypothetical protein [Actinomycetota bacterium]
MHPLVDAQVAAAFGQEVVEPDLVAVAVEHHGGAALVVDEVGGAGDAGVGDAFQDGELAAGGSLDGGAGLLGRRPIDEVEADTAYDAVQDGVPAEVVLPPPPLGKHVLVDQHRPHGAAADAAADARLVQQLGDLPSALTVDGFPLVTERSGEEAVSNLGQFGGGEESRP